METIQFTRRGLLSKVTGIFDPLGLAYPVSVKAKISLQQLGVKGLEWDTTIPDEDRNWWLKWVTGLNQLNKLYIPRYLYPQEVTIKTSELHTFCDASEEAFAASVYIHNRYKSGAT